MDRTAFFNEIFPSQFISDAKNVPSGKDSLKVFDKKNNNKLKDVNFIKKIAREKVKISGAPIQYFPIDPSSVNTSTINQENILQDHTDISLSAPISMIATWTPQEYQLDLSKWGVMMPTGTDQQLFIHVDELTEKLKRKPLIGDIIETSLDRVRFKVADVFFGNANLWENIFCMVTLSKISYDNYTSQLDKYDAPEDLSYKETYTRLTEILDVMDGSEHHKSNAEIQKTKVKTDDPNKPRKRSLDTALDIMTMTL